MTTQTEAYWQNQQDALETINTIIERDGTDKATIAFDYMAVAGFGGSDLHDNTYNQIEQMLETAKQSEEDEAVASSWEAHLNYQSHVTS
jgi:hypothetical protein